MRALRIVLLPAVLVLSSLVQPQVGHAIEPRLWDEYCGGSTFVFCASVQAHNNIGGLNFDIMNLSGRNASNARAIITNAGLFNLEDRGIIYHFDHNTAAGWHRSPEGQYMHYTGQWDAEESAAIAHPRVAFEGEGRKFALFPRFWYLSYLSPNGLVGSVGSSCGLADLPTDELLWITPTCTYEGLVHSTGNASASPWLRFHVYDEWYSGLGSLATRHPYTLAGADLYLRAVDPVTGELSEMWTGGARVNAATVTPEPMSMALLGTGLAGIAGVAWRRRRKQEGMDA